MIKSLKSVKIENVQKNGNNGTWKKENKVNYNVLGSGNIPINLNIVKSDPINMSMRIKLQKQVFGKLTPRPLLRQLLNFSDSNVFELLQYHLQ